MTMEAEMDFDSDDGLEELQSELERVDFSQIVYIEDSTDEINPTASQEETHLRHRRMSEHTGSLIDNIELVSNDLQNELNLQELRSFFATSEVESQCEDIGNLAIVSPSPSRNNPDFGFIRRESLYNLVTHMGTLYDSINDITKEPSRRGSLNRQLSSSMTMEAEMDFDSDDGLEELQNEIERVNSLQTEPSIYGSERYDTDVSFILSSSLPTNMPEQQHGFIVQESLQIPATQLSDLENTIMEITCKPIRRQLLKQLVPEHNLDIVDEIPDFFQNKLDQLNYKNSTGNEVSSSVTGKLSSQVKELCTVPQYQQMLQVLQERNNAINGQLDEIREERNRLKERQDEVTTIEEEHTSDRIHIRYLKWVAYILDRSYDKRKWILWLCGCIFLVILLLTSLPVGASILSLFKGRNSTMLVGDNTFPSEITALEERGVLHDSELKDAKQALIQVKIILTETQELVSKFMEDQLVMDSIVHILQLENTQLKTNIKFSNISLKEFESNVEVRMISS